jgi:hypothetical protein
MMSKREEQEARRLEVERVKKEEQRALEAEKQAQRWRQAEADSIAAKQEDERRQREKKECEYQRICETSEELRELEKILNMAYMKKERAAQQEEQKLLQHVQQVEEASLDQLMEMHRHQGLQDESSRQFDLRFDPEKFKLDIQSQLAEKQHRRREQEAMIAAGDKALIEQAMLKEERQEKERLNATAKRNQEFRKRRLEHERERVQAQREKERQEAMEEARIREFEAKQAVRVETNKQRHSDRQARQKEAVARIVAEAKQRQIAEEELEALRDLLYAEEKEAARLEACQQRLAQKRRDQEELRKAQEEQRQLRGEQMALARLAEEKLVAEMQAKYAIELQQDNRLAQKRREAQQKYKMLLREQIEDGRRLAQEARRAVREPSTEGLASDTYKQNIIAEARKRLLMEHASRLGPFLPKSLALEVQQAHGIGPNDSKC